MEQGDSSILYKIISSYKGEPLSKKRAGFIKEIVL